MQSNAVNVLVAIGGSAPTNAGAVGAGATGDDTPAGQQFSQLLSDSGAQTYGDGAPQFARGQLQSSVAAGAIAAQEVVLDSAEALSGVLGSSDHVVTADEATTLIARIDQLIQRDGEKAEILALNQIKAQLQGIVRGEEPKTVATILQAAPAAKESKLTLLGLIALFASRKNSANTSKEEAPTQASIALQNVSAAIFRPVDGEAASASTGTPEEAQALNAADVTTIVAPLAATFVVVAPAPSGNAASQAANNARSLDQRIADLDAAIAPLALNDPKKLPEVDLPALSEDILPNATSQSIAALSDTGATAKPIIAISDKSLSSFASLLNPSHGGGFSPTQTAQAAQPISLVPTHGYLNQAPVTEQVKVAVHQAAADGLSRITIQLDPLDLGRVEVNMQTTRDGVTSISFMVDKPETFDSLTRDARFLERALLEVGIKSDTGNMQFNLRQPPQPQLHSNLGGQGQHQHPHAQQQHAANDAQRDGVPAAIISTTQHYMLAVREGVDISA